MIYLNFNEPSLWKNVPRSKCALYVIPPCASQPKWYWRRTQSSISWPILLLWSILYSRHNTMCCIEREQKPRRKRCMMREEVCLQKKARKVWTRHWIFRRGKRHHIHFCCQHEFRTLITVFWRTLLSATSLICWGLLGNSLMTVCAALECRLSLLSIQYKNHIRNALLEKPYGYFCLDTR